MKTIIFLLGIFLYCSSVGAEEGEKRVHVFVMDRDQQFELAGKTQAEERFDLVWHYWGDVDLIENEMGKGLPRDQAKALKVMKQRIAAMTESDKAALGNAWRGRHMASDIGVNPDNMPAVWADGRVFTHVEDLRHVFSRIK
jgi:hypothetical protein